MKKADLPLPLDPVFLKAHRATDLRVLEQWRDLKRVPPVLLLTGPRGVGKRSLACYIAQTLQCERAGFSIVQEEASLFGGGGLGSSADSPPSAASAGTDATLPSPCGECAACERLLNGNAFDFREITTLGDSTSLKIDQFRELKEQAGFGSFEGSYKVFLIPDAERMTVQAANSLLKILEEPPAGWVFLLTASDPSLLPATVTSRCQMLRVKPLEEGDLRDVLRAHELPADRAELCAKISQGCVGRALRLAETEFWDKRGLLLEFLAHPGGSLNALVDWISQEETHQNLFLDQFELLLMDLIAYGQTGKLEPKNVDAVKTLGEQIRTAEKRFVGRAGALRFWMERMERLFRLRREFTLPLNAKILAQDFLIPWL